MTMISTNNFPKTYSPPSVDPKTVPTVAHRCSSPRQFFEKLYGHLETSSTPKSVIAESKINQSPIQSELSSSPGFMDERWVGWFSRTTAGGFAEIIKRSSASRSRLLFEVLFPFVVYWIDQIIHWDHINHWGQSRFCHQHSEAFECLMKIKYQPDFKRFVSLHFS